MMSPSRFWMSIAAVVATHMSLPAEAAMFRVAPVTLDLQSGNQAGVLTLTNLSNAPITIQLRPFRWSQTNETDVLEPAEDVIASPPIARIPVGGQHVIRIVRVGAPPAAGEQAYRLLVDEIPDSRASAGELRLLLRQSIPVFFNSGPTGPLSLRWSLRRGGSGWEVVAQNLGSRRQRISDLVATNRAGAVLAQRTGLIGYVLPGATMSWPLPLSGSSGGPVTISVMLDSGALRADLAAPEGS